MFAKEGAEPLTTVLAFLEAIGLILVALIMLGGIITVHEAGHFAIAKWVGITVEEFCVGIGPAVLRRTSGGTRYVIRLLPVFGYVKTTVDGTSSVRNPLWARALFFAGGPLANFVTATFLAMPLLQMMAAAHGETLQLGKLLLGALLIVPKAFGFFVSGLGTNGGHLQGVGAAVAAGSQALLQGPLPVMVWFEAISLSVGIINLVPFPPLDGGQLLLCGLEAIRRKPLPAKLEERIMQFGAATIMILIVVISIRDAITQ